MIGLVQLMIQEAQLDSISFGSAIFLGINKKKVVAQSSTEVKYIAIALAANHA